LPHSLGQNGEDALWWSGGRAIKEMGDRVWVAALTEGLWRRVSEMERHMGKVAEAVESGDGGGHG
jgi:hypothetical protein